MKYPSMLVFAAAVFVLVFMCQPSFAGLAANGPKSDPQGMIAFNDHCRECHSYDPGDNRIGPSLAGVVGRQAGTEKGFDYSQSLKGAEFKWSPELLDQWITNPNAVVPGNNMGSLFPGLDDAKIRKQIVGFLEAISPKAGDTAK